MSHTYSYNALPAVQSIRRIPKHQTLGKIAAAVALGLLMATGAAAQAGADPLKAAVEKAVLSNPEVTARLNAYRASTDAIDVSRAALRPRVDLQASVGRDSDRIDSRGPERQSFSRSGASLSLTQLLWDGMGTRRDVARVGHESLARWFELIDATEQTALEAARAYYDVQRMRRMVELAEDNYVQHKYASLQIGSRVRAGVGRGVDLEQANARLALAESNLTTELANLHDVTARYQRIVGEAPPAELPAHAPLTAHMPETAADASRGAIARSAAISASVENLRAVRATVEMQRAAYQPRVEARVRTGAGHNFDGIRDQRRDSSAELVLNWNLYSGGADQARVRQQADLLNQAADLRDRACRDTRQTAAIAFNDTRKLAEQLISLDRNTLAIEKARDAYRQQFDIGQRSLLDLLNAENEVYTARRAYANAQYDLAVAYARTHAALNQLNAQLGIARPVGEDDAAAGWSSLGDEPGRCPVEPNIVVGTSRAELDARARQIADSVAPAGMSRQAPTR